MQLLPWAKWESLQKEWGERMKERERGERDRLGIVFHSKTPRQKPPSTLLALSTRGRDLEAEGVFLEGAKVQSQGRQFSVVFHVLLFLFVFKLNTFLPSFPVLTSVPEAQRSASCFLTQIFSRHGVRGKRIGEALYNLLLYPLPIKCRRILTWGDVKEAYSTLLWSLCKRMEKWNEFSSLFWDPLCRQAPFIKRLSQDSFA